MLRRIPFVDTHTGGEPTRIVYDLPLDFPVGSVQASRDFLRDAHDDLRRAILSEPRGSDVLVGAVVLPPSQPGSLGSMVFVNNVGYLGMCGHGTIGLAVGLQHLGRLTDGKHHLDTVVGSVPITVSGNRVEFQNVKSYRYAAAVPLTLDDGQTIHGDIAWGGNWFFICADHGLSLETSNIESLSGYARRVRRQLDQQPIRAAGGEVIDHIELVGPPSRAELADGKNFVLCPGGAFDRSPCGTGTSAKVACLAADGILAAGQLWRQESIVGSVFEARYAACPASDTSPVAGVIPTISGTAYVCGQGELILDSDDPFCMGIPF